jgi:chemotaxis protein MotA
MDIATIVGLLVGNGLLFLAIKDNLGQFIDIPSIEIVVGGTLGTVLMAIPLKRFLSAFSVVRHAFLGKALNPAEIIGKLVRSSEIARRDGILALEGVLAEMDDKFMVKGLQMAVDGSDPEAIQDALNTELEQLQKRHLDGKIIFDDIAKYAPAMGLLGTLIGLIAMLANLDDPDKIAPSMAVALITTLYGAYLANCLAMPIAEKLMVRNNEEVLVKEMVVQGVMSIQSGDNPKVVEQKLKLYLAPKVRGE